MENLEDKYQHIVGWGYDADPDNEPTYPMKQYTGDDHNRLNWARPTLQKTSIEILKSNERPSLSAVFGTSVPPTGLSGAIRRFAFKYSESSYGHWLPLLLADRINVVEGVMNDFSKGVIPNFFAEKGWRAELKYNPKGAVKKVVVTAAISYVILKIIQKKLR